MLAGAELAAAIVTHSTFTLSASMGWMYCFVYYPDI